MMLPVFRRYEDVGRHIRVGGGDVADEPDLLLFLVVRRGAFRIVHVQAIVANSDSMQFIHLGHDSLNRCSIQPARAQAINDRNTSRSTKRRGASPSRGFRRIKWLHSVDTLRCIPINAGTLRSQEIDELKALIDRVVTTLTVYRFR